MAIAGIDCGKDGAVVVISGPSFALEIHRYVTPMLGEGRREYDLQRMRWILVSHTLEFVALERQQPMKTGGKYDGSKQAFGTGLGYGLWMGLLTGLSIPFETVISKTWQKAMHKDVMGPNTKVKSALVAQRLHPTIDWRRTPRCKSPHDGLVDAFCIAEWARRKLASHCAPVDAEYAIEAAESEALEHVPTAESGASDG